LRRTSTTTGALSSDSPSVVRSTSVAWRMKACKAGRRTASSVKASRPTRPPIQAAAAQ
jgi:hypothetical protein